MEMTVRIARDAVGRAAAGAAMVASALLLSACGTPLVKPADMAVPAQASCFTLAEPLQGVEVRGLFKLVWTLRLERGPYISVHEDANGTYFRAPPGGMHQSTPEGRAATYANISNMTFDGGVYVPRDPALPVKTYAYMTLDPVPPVVPAPDVTCATAAIVRNPVTKGLDVASYAIVGGAAGAAGGLAARAAAPNSSVSYGKAAGVGAAGGAIAMVLVAAIINNDLGKVSSNAVHPDAEFTAKLTKVARGAAPIKETIVATAAAPN